MLFKLFSFFLTFIIAQGGGIEDTVTEVPTVTCPNNKEHSNNRNLLIVSTIDGKISAFHPSDGQLAWSFATDSGSLLSSTFTDMNNSFRSQETRIIPSLDGTLYKFDGKKLQLFPISTEMLLRTSYKIGDNLHVVGNKDIKSYGLNLNTGELKYICSSDGCQKFSAVNESEDVLIVERHSQIIRAVNSRNGEEQWSYTVGEHRIKLSHGDSQKVELPSTSDVASASKDFFTPPGNSDNSTSGYKVAMLKGCIGKVNLSNNSYLWSQELSSPIVNVWKFQEDSFISLDIYKRAGFIKENVELQTLLLEGVFPDQMCIKQSFRKGMCSNLATPSPTSLTLRQNLDKGVMFYDTDSDVSNGTCQHAEVPQVSFWSFLYNWKEMLTVSVLTSIFSHFLGCLIYKKYYQPNRYQQLSDRYESAQGEPVIIQTDATVTQHSDLPQDKNRLERSRTPSTSFQSRYLTEFDIIECLGKGGFGVVFEVQNKIDCCSYAVKRIKLTKGHAFDRVLREVKVLAKLDHKGIIRYYNAWVEEPPVELQESYNKDCQEFPSSSSMQSNTSYSVSESSRREFSHYSKRVARRSDNVNPLKLFNEDLFGSSDDSLLHRPTPSTASNSSISQSVISSDKGKTADSSIVFISKSEEKQPHEVIVIDSTTTSKYLYIQMQICKKETLKDWLLSNIKERDLNVVLDIFYQIVCAVEYVHEKGLIHRDLKPSNIFFSMDGVVKIGDFGLVSYVNEEEVASEFHFSTSLKPKYTDEVGTKLYMSPEMVHRLDYTFKVDIFSLGIILFELLVPFTTQYERIQVLTEIKTGVFPETFGKNHEVECVLAASLLEKNPARRPSASEIKRHSLFDAIQKRHSSC